MSNRSSDNVNAWRGLLSAAVQWMLFVPFLVLSLFVLSVTPDNPNPDAILAGHWSSALADEWAGQPPMDLDIDAEGGFEMRVYRTEPGQRPLVLRGRYEVVQGALVLSVGGHHMFWSILARDGALTHRTDRGHAYRLERTAPGLGSPPAAADSSMAAASY